MVSDRDSSMPPIEDVLEFNLYDAIGTFMQHLHVTKSEMIEVCKQVITDCAANMEGK